VKGFLDPAVQFGLQFEVVQADAKDEAAEIRAKKTRNANNPIKVETADAEKPTEEGKPPESTEEPKVVSLDAFRKK
jgi:uncharacterized protein